MKELDRLRKFNLITAPTPWIQLVLAGLWAIIFIINLVNGKNQIAMLNALCVALFITAFTIAYQTRINRALLQKIEDLEKQLNEK